jgi:hypothetical protein
MNEDLPSISEFIEDRSDLPSINESVDEVLPSYKDFLEKKEEVKEIVEEAVPQVVEQRTDNTELIINLIESVRESIPEVKSYDKELYDLMNLIEEVRKEIPVLPEPPEIPEVRYYDEEIQELKESIPVVPEVRYYDEQISELQESIQEVKGRDIPDFRWISKSFSTIDQDFDTLNESLSTLRGKLDLDMVNLLDTIEVTKFESKVDTKTVKEELDSVDSRLTSTTKEIAENLTEIKGKIYKELREASLRIWNLKNQTDKEDDKLRAKINEEYKALSISIDEVFESSNSNHEFATSYFDELKEEIRSLPEVKYYDEEIGKVSKSVDNVRNLVEVLENKLNRKIKGLKESILVVPPTENNTDPLTPLDQNFATLDDLSNHYRLFLNRVQQQLASLGGGGEVRLEFLDDVDRSTAKVDGKFLKYEASSGKWVGATGAGGGADTETVRDAIQGYYGYTTDFYTVGVANTVQEIGAGVTTLIQPQVAAIYQYMPKVMSDVNINPYVGTGATIGTGQTEFSLAGLSSGASCIVRTALAFNPDDNNSNLDIQLKFTTNTTTQGTGLKHFTIKKEQALIMNEGAGQQYISENLFNFFVGTTLEGTAQSDAGSFNIEVVPTSEGELEVLAVTVNVTT